MYEAPSLKKALKKTKNELPSGAQAVSLFFLLKSLLKGKTAWAPTLKTALKKDKKEATICSFPRKTLYKKKDFPKERLQQGLFSTGLALKKAFLEGLFFKENR